MTTAMRGRPGRGVGPLKEKTIHAALTKQRIHAIVGQVLDELEHRRATGKADYVKALADEVQRGGVAGLKSLRDLLPRDEDVPGGHAAPVSFSQLFVSAAREASRLEPPKIALPIIDVVAEPVAAEPLEAVAEEIATEAVEW